MPQLDNWSIPPFETEPGKPWTTQCWGPVSKPLYGCDQRWPDGVMCWGTFDSKYCNEVDQVPMTNPLNPLAPLVDAVNARALGPHHTRAVAMSQYALARQPPVTTAVRAVSSQCWGDPGMPSMCAYSLGDGVVAAAGYKNCLDQSV